MQNPEMLPCSRLRRVVLALGAGLLLSVFSAGSARADSDECAYFNPFMALCCKGTAEQVREAARQGAQVNMRIESEEGGRGALTPLIAAAGNNNRPVVRALLDAGADLNASLMEAAQNGSVPETRQMRLLQVLLAEGPNVNGRDDLGNTPLLVAALP
ncbi:MAG: ankyrin repeat domain-containing protein, partial [Ottowia sp.]|nr:ankyrin repeat domain-containing protein [Ottowia sp.]